MAATIALTLVPPRDLCAVKGLAPVSEYSFPDLFPTRFAAPAADVPVPTRIYGEMVDVLAAHAEFKSAIALERAWTQALTGLPASLLCGYASERFGDPSTALALRSICHHHDEVRTSPNDLLASWLVADSKRAH